MPSKVQSVQESPIACSDVMRRQIQELLADHERSARALRDLHVRFAELRDTERRSAEARGNVSKAVFAARAGLIDPTRGLPAIIPPPPPVRGWTAKRRADRAFARQRRELAASIAFRADFYLDANPDVAAVGMDPVEHYIRHGWREFRRPHPLFDGAWYLATNPDVLASGVDPLTHYLRDGGRERRRVNRLFDGQWYLAYYKDVSDEGCDPFLHYLKHGAAEGRWPHPLFDPGWYSSTYGLSSGEPWGAFLHYLTAGVKLGARPNRFFDPISYGSTHEDLLGYAGELLDHYHRVGGPEGRNPSPDFDVAAYRAAYPDVAATNVDPLAHYLHVGCKEGRVVSVERTQPNRAKIGKVVFVASEHGNHSHGYRVRHKVEILRDAGFEANWVEAGAVAHDLSLVAGADLVVFARTGHSDMEAVINVCRSAGTRVVYDIDDHVFDPAVANTIYVDGLREVPASLLDGYYQGVLEYRRMVFACDLTIVTTERLRQAVEALGRQARIVPNGARAAILEASEEAHRRRRPTEGTVIGFASGTKTHQRDFGLVAPVLARIMNARPDVRLRIVGALNLAEFPELGALADRIDERPAVVPERLAFEYAAFDINLAPLEIGNPYCEAKSALKYLEAALVGVPTVASATEPFRAAIIEGATGFLASTEADWEAALLRLIDEPRLASTIGEAARDDVIKIKTPRHDALLLELFSDLVLGRTPAKPVPLAAETRGSPGRLKNLPTRPARPVRIGWVVPGLIIGGGGHRNILRAAHYLQSFGHDVGLYFQSTHDDAETLRTLVRRHFYPFDGRVERVEHVAQGTDDVVFATHFSTVDYARELTGPAAQTFYFVQDFEPAFAPMSSAYIRAENTYRLGLYAITSGPWCARVLRRTYGMEADPFRFPVDRSVYCPRAGVERRDRIAFFAKPEMDRRCFEIGAEALAHVNALRPDVEIVFFGSQEARDRVAFPVTTLGVLPGIGDLSQLYSSAKLGLVFSTTNPSLVPYEMMACGLPVVDLDRADNEANYDDRRDIAFLADPNPRVMANQIVALLGDEEQLAQRSRAGLAFASRFPSELEMARRVECLILARLSGQPAPPDI